jgi:hypothetical protein
MSNASGIKVKGYKASIKSLQAIGVPTTEIKAAGSAAGELVAAEARSLVPVRSGALRQSIRVSKALGKVEIKAGNENRLPYANPIHWGWIYDKDNFVRKNIKPTPFFSASLKKKRKEVYEKYYAEMDKLIAKYSTTGTEE